MATHKEQHYVAQSYLEAWCDPDCPAQQTPYVWRFNKDGSNPKKKAPKNIFWETDMYTIHREGKRDLVLEHGLSQLEGAFALVRREKLSKRENLTEMEHFVVCAFVAASHARTPVRREFLRQQWQRPLKMMDDLDARMKRAKPEERQRMANIPSLSSGGPSFSHSQVREIVETPLQTLLPSEISTIAPLLTRLDFYIIETDDEVGFVTSDHPCVWYDAAGYKRPPLYQSPALCYETIEITLPISPRQILVLNRIGMSGYGKALNDTAAKVLNARTRFFAGEHFVVCKNFTDPSWFEIGDEPEDSWEKMNPSSPDN
jgi:Protein of unknown function (DUF4238)